MNAPVSVLLSGGQSTDAMAMTVLEAVAGSVTSPVMIVDEAGVILWVNGPMARLFGLERPAMTGRPITDLLPADAANERLAVIRRVFAGGGPGAAKKVELREVTGGVRFRTLLQELPFSVFGKKAVLEVARPELQAPWLGEEASEVVDAQSNDMGRLSVLTKRELEVLQLLGEGLSTAAIARRLHRSEKTVKSHRLAIGRKLGVKGRVMLARTAMTSGLSPLIEVKQLLPAWAGRNGERVAVN